MATLFDMIFQSHTKMGTIRFDTSSAGSAVLVNAQTYSSGHSDDQFNNGTLFIIRSTNAGTTSIDSQFRRISDYDASSGQFTLSSALATAVTAGTAFGYTTPEFPHELSIELANQALQSLGPITTIDDSIVSSVGQTLYGLSTLVGFGPPLSVEYQLSTVGLAPNSTVGIRYKTIYDYDYIPTTAAGTRASIRLSSPIIQGRGIRVYFGGQHVRISASTASYSAYIHPELASLVLVEKMYEYRNSLNRGSVEFDLQRWNDSKRQVQEAKVRWPIWSFKRDPKLFIPGDDRGGRRGGDRLPWAPPYGPS